MKRKVTGKGLMVMGSLRTDGITTYMKQGKMITRVSNSNERHSNTLPQFIQRQKMRHTIALWKMLKGCETVFTERATAYQNFASLANRLPVVFVPDNGQMKGASFLMPDIPVSDGKLPAINEQLGEIDGVPALITNLKGEAWAPQTKLLLYTAEQHIEYKNQAFLGDEIKGTTWVAAYGKVATIRKCKFERVSDGKVIFESETQWVLVDLNRGRPMAISDEMKKLYVEGA